MTFDRCIPTPTPSIPSIGRLPFFYAPEWGRELGWADSLPLADAYQPPASPPTNCQLTGSAARFAAPASCSAARPWAHTAHV